MAKTRELTDAQRKALEDQRAQRESERAYEEACHAVRK